MMKEVVREKSDIVDVIESYSVELNGNGVEYKGICPFHEEKDASFTVNKEKQVWNCFGCNKGGDVFKFIELKLGVDFPEALSVLAKRAGINLNTGSLSYDEIMKYNRLYQGLYRKELSQSKEGAKYCLERKIDPKMVDKFGIGYCPAKKLKNVKLQDDLQSIGLVNKGGYYYFNNRLTFPYYNSNGEIIGFSGRTVPDNEIKYLNSPNTGVFDKSNELYGLHQAKEKILDKKFCILVEGQIDVVMMHQFEFDTTMGLSCCSLSSSQVNKIKELTDRVYLFFDGDSAGIEATKKSILTFGDEFKIKVAETPGRLDPASFLLERGRGQLVELLQNAIAGIEWLEKYIELKLRLAKESENPLEKINKLLK